MADEQAEPAESEQPTVPAAAEQQETAETVTTETPTEQPAAEAKVEGQETKPEVITKAEAEALAAKAVADLQRQYDRRLQDNAHNAKLAEALEKLNDQLSGKKPVDPDAIPVELEAFPEPAQKLIVSLTNKVKEIEKQQRDSVKKTIENSVESEVKAFRADPQTGALFKAVELAISDDITRNPELQHWMRRDPHECLETLFAKHARGKTQEVKAEANKAKVEVAKSVSQRPSQASTATATAKPDDVPDFDAAFERQWAAKVGAGRNYIDQQ